MHLFNAHQRVSAPLSFGRHLAALLALTLVTPGVWAANIFDDNWQPPRGDEAGGGCADASGTAASPSHTHHAQAGHWE